MGFADVELTDVLPCGCKLYKRHSDRAFMIDPCSHSCEYYEYAIEESRRTGKPVKAEFKLPHTAN